MTKIAWKQGTLAEYLPERICKLTEIASDYAGYLRMKESRVTK